MDERTVASDAWTPSAITRRAFLGTAAAVNCLAVTAKFAANLLAQQARLEHFAPPPMGWSSWNSFVNTVDSRIVAAQGRAMTATGMRSPGYQYVSIDEGW